MFDHFISKKRIIPFLIFAAALCMLSGCSTKKGSTGGGADAEAAAETDLEENTETATEMMTEEMPYRPISEILDEERLAWAEQFDASLVEKMVYSNYGEETTEYEVTDPVMIGKFYDALMQLMVAGQVASFAADAGDAYDFIMKDGTTIRFEFNMGSLLVDERLYETDQSDELWDLTGKLIPDQDL